MRWATLEPSSTSAAGTGSYEPSERGTVALEPSSVMISQRPIGAAPVVQGHAESLPFPDDAFDVTLAILTVHHWHDGQGGSRRLGRVSIRQVVVTWDPERHRRFWLPATTSGAPARGAPSDPRHDRRRAARPAGHDAARTRPTAPTGSRTRTGDDRRPTSIRTRAVGHLGHRAARPGGGRAVARLRDDRVAGHRGDADLGLLGDELQDLELRCWSPTACSTLTSRTNAVALRRTRSAASCANARSPSSPASLRLDVGDGRADACVAPPRPGR